MGENIIILFGGTSKERLVSVASGQHLAKTVDNARLWFWDINNQVIEVDIGDLLDHKNPFTTEFKPLKKPLFNSLEESLLTHHVKDAVFILGVHGGSSENGYIQNLFEDQGLAFTGSGSAASSVTFNKIETKSCLASSLNMARHEVIACPDDITKLAPFFAGVGPMVIKPICGGSTIGSHFVRHASGLESALATIRRGPFEPLMVENFISGIEVTMGIMETPHGLQALPATEIAKAADREFDYEGKYLGLGTKEITPARISQDQLSAVQKVAFTAHQGLRLSGYSRTDMIIAGDGIYYLETNSLPGLAEQSLIPQQLREAKISMKEFLNMQIELAKRACRQKNNT